MTHVLLDTWYSAKRLWRAARERGFFITSGLKSNRWLRVEDQRPPRDGDGSDSATIQPSLSDSDYVQLKWPKGEEDVYVHVVTTRVRKLYLLPGRDRAPVVGCSAVAGTLLGFQRSGGFPGDAARPYRCALGHRGPLW